MHTITNPDRNENLRALGAIVPYTVRLTVNVPGMRMARGEGGQRDRTRERARRDGTGEKESV